MQISSGSPSRIASTYYAATTFTININLTDGKTHRFALYLLDWDTTARAENISILNAATGAVLDTEAYLQLPQPPVRSLEYKWKRADSGDKDGWGERCRQRRLL